MATRPGLLSMVRMYQRDTRANIIRRIQTDPSLVAAGTMNGSWWRRFVATVVISTSLVMLLFLAIEVANVWISDGDCRKNVYLPLWLGVNWPRQRVFPYPAYRDLVDSDAVQALDLSSLRESVPSQVLDCLFRLPTVRETYGIPLKVAPTTNDDFEVWIEPQYPTVHGPKVAIAKENGKLTVACSWSIKLLNWDMVDCVQGTLWRIGNLLSPAPGTQDYGNTQIHEIHKDASPHVSRLPGFKLMFRGHLSISSRDHSGVVLFKGILDTNHLDLNHGSRLTSVDLKMSEEGRLILYKVFDDHHP